MFSHSNDFPKVSMSKLMNYSQRLTGIDVNNEGL